ncbi:hypothetical protein C8N24_0224 [Solirubrobacter pauli]|uniref:Uncharacterized protein n=1 Tax=Solirubrobacter pauli TaxID=166793 RepID=A0A660L5N7_9ACTN|nr:hypothetical protein [Solirubrobacter pauli]RKQ90422.1 hypothetical protein C8N24_0224 [Solirubrobacter pauli]
MLQNYPQDALTACRLDYGHDSFLWFYAFLLDAVQYYTPPSLNLRGYVDSADLEEGARIDDIVPIRPEAEPPE